MTRETAGWRLQVMPFGHPLPLLLDCVPNMQTSPSDPRFFNTTSWSLVLAAVHPSADSRQALASLCQAYWQPVYAFIRRNAHGPDQAQDLTQAFFAEFLEKNYVRSADRTRGRFRSFLLSAVKHFLSHERDRAQALKRGGGQTHLSIDGAVAENWYAPATGSQSPALPLMALSKRNTRSGTAGRWLESSPTCANPRPWSWQ